MKNKEEGKRHILLTLHGTWMEKYFYSILLYPSCSFFPTKTHDAVSGECIQKVFFSSSFLFVKLSRWKTFIIRLLKDCVLLMLMFM